MTTTLREISAGHEHNRLAEVAKTLTDDGLTELAAEYRARAERVETAFIHLRDLDRLTGGSGLDAKRGLGILEELVRLGWTPPAHMIPRGES